MAKLHHLNIEQYYSILNKILVSPSLLSGSDQLTLYVIAKALLEDIKEVGELKEMLIHLQNSTSYRYFSQSDFTYKNTLFKDLDDVFESKKSSAYRSKHDKDTHKIKKVSSKRLDPIEIYRLYKYDDNTKFDIDIFRCLWIIFEFLDSIKYELFIQVLQQLTKRSLDVLELKAILKEIESLDFIYCDKEEIISWNLPPYEIFDGEGDFNLVHDLRKLIALFRKLKEFHLIMNLGYYFYSNSQFEDAISCYRNITENADDIKYKKLIAGAFNDWGNCLVEMKKLEQACDLFQKAIRTDNTYAQPQYNWGATLLKLQQYEEANKKLLEAIKLEPSYAVAYFENGICLQKMKKFNDAHQNFETAIKLNPNYIQAYNNDGNVLVELERYEEACLRYRKTIEIDPDFAGGYLNLGRILPKIKYYKNDPNEIFELNLKAYFLFIIRDELEYARKTSVLNILKNQNHTFWKNIVYIFNIGIMLVLNNDMALSDLQIKRIQEFKEKSKKITNKAIDSAYIVIDAMINKKEPDTEIDLDEEGIALRAAIVLSKKIIAIE